MIQQDESNYWTIKLDKHIQFHCVKDTFRMSFFVSRRIHFKRMHNRLITNKVLFKINLADLSICLFCKKLLFIIFSSVKM